MPAHPEQKNYFFLREPDSFARYLAEVVVAKRGFAEGTVPEAQKLAAAADIVLTSPTG